MKAKKVYEAMGDVLKPKENINKIFSDHGINSDQVSVRIRKPGVDYVESRFNRALKYANVKAKEYKGPVPEEESEEGFIEVYGKPWNVLNFVKTYFQWMEAPANHQISKLKTILINEAYISDINLDALKPKLLQMIYDTSYDMMITAYKFEENIDEEDDEIEESEDFKLWLDYEVEIRLKESLEKLNRQIDSDGNIKIWREMIVADDWFEQLQTSGKRLGEYWSWDKSSAEAHWGYNTEKNNKVLIQSVINEKYIDWETTILINADPSFEEENEIRLFKNTPIKIEKLEINSEEVNISSIKNKIFKT